MPSPCNYIAFGRKYEELRELAEAGKLGDRVREWHEAMAKVERIAREEGGFCTSKWTYSWDHRNDCLRRWPTFKDVVVAAKPTRVVKMPPRLRLQFETNDERINLAG